MSVSEAIKQAYARAGSTTVHMIALEMRHESWPSPLRMINHRSDITLKLENDAPANPGQQVLFVATAMRVQEPQIGTDPAGEMEIQIDGVAGVLHSFIDAANGLSTPIDATIRAVALDSSNDSVIDVFTPYDLQVKNVGINLTDVMVTFGRISPVNLPFPNAKYGPDTYPQLYK